MAHLSQRRAENIAGDLYIDSSCIDCDTCRWIAPGIFHRAGSQSAVHHQPTNESERLKAMQALLACPTASIGTIEKPTDIKTAQQSFPLVVAKNVHHCGYHSEKSYGAASYFIQRLEGNILVDSPRFTPPLVKRLEDMGGIRYMYLTHRDDVADHQKFQQHFGCERILHQDDITADTDSVEIQLFGIEPIALTDDLLIIPVPGHTKGHTVLLYDNQFLFTGDHLAWSTPWHHLYAFQRFCWYDWPKQIQSMHRLANYSFEWVLPGHGHRYHADRKTMHEQMQQCLHWMEKSVA
ncbi:MAG: MBL fold metallo-hydrolase [Cyanothece sp. SIO1E1]|nr:MBL fold metallo-hydrolase [Cyanothece sp. SIO1E1]